MDGHFRAFSFVDRISEDQPGVRIRGVYRVPENLREFYTPLVAEAVGQLAAWSSMAVLDFKFRPVAGIAASVELLSSVRPGQTLELAADIESVDNDAVAYGGTAHADGVPVVKLNHCVGPMLPQEDFDDPQAVKNRYSLLRATGAVSGAFDGVPKIEFQNVTGETSERVRAMLPIPNSAPFFADHFARRPVFPGTLFMQKVLELAGQVAKNFAENGNTWTAREVTDGKMRTFIPPGDSLDFEAKLEERGVDSLVVLVEARKGKRVTGSSRIHFKAEKKL